MPGQDHCLQVSGRLEDPSLVERLREQAELEERLRAKAEALQAKLDALRPGWIALPDGEFPVGNRGDLIVLSFRHLRDESVRYEILAFDRHWANAGGWWPGRGTWALEAYLPLRREHVEAVLAPRRRGGA